MKYVKTYEDIKDFYKKFSHFYLISKDKKWIIQKNWLRDYYDGDRVSTQAAVVDDGKDFERYADVYKFSNHEQARDFKTLAAERNFKFYDSTSKPKGNIADWEIIDLSIDDFEVVEYQSALVKITDDDPNIG